MMMMMMMMKLSRLVYNETRRL